MGEGSRRLSVAIPPVSGRNLRHAPRRGAETLRWRDRWVRLSLRASLPTGYLHWPLQGRSQRQGTTSIPRKTKAFAITEASTARRLKNLQHQAKALNMTLVPAQ